MVSLLLGIIVGMLIGRFFRTPDEICPRIVAHYPCKGPGACDHRKSELYRAKMNRALQREERANRNYWQNDDER